MTCMIITPPFSLVVLWLPAELEWNAFANVPDVDFAAEVEFALNCVSQLASLHRSQA